MCTPLPYQHRAHDRQRHHHAHQQERRDEEVVRLVAQVGMHTVATLGQCDDAVDRRCDPRPQHTDQHSDDRQADDHRDSGAATRNSRCANLIGRHYRRFARVAHRSVSRSVESSTAVTGALGRPPVGAHLHHHPPAALCAEPRWLKAELGRSGHRAAGGFASVDVELGRPHQTNHSYIVALSALIGICRSSSSSRSASAGRPSVVR